jgi:hypothetical protein
MWKNIVELGRPQMTIWHMHFACWIPEATNTRSDYVILLLFHSCSGCTNAPQCYVICTLPQEGYLTYKWRSRVSLWVILVLLKWKVRSCWKLWSLLWREHYLFTSLSSIVAGYWLPFCFRVVYCALIVAVCSCWIRINPTHHRLHFYEFLGLHNSVVVVFALVGCAATSLGKWCRIFWDSIMVSECWAPIAQSCGATSQKNQLFVGGSCIHVCVCLFLNRYPHM